MNMNINMTSNRPYLIRAIYDWIVDNNMTPYLLVSADYPGVQLPLDYVKEGQIVLNISPQACRGLHLNNDRIVFTARFSGKTEQLVVFPSAVLAIYAKENGAGMEFSLELPKGSQKSLSSSSPNASQTSKKNKPHLTLVKKADKNVDS